MTFDNVITKLINTIVEGIESTEDKEVLEKYQRILNFLNRFVGGNKNGTERF